MRVSINTRKWMSLEHMIPNQQNGASGIEQLPDPLARYKFIRVINDGNKKKRFMKNVCCTAHEKQISDNERKQRIFLLLQLSG